VQLQAGQPGLDPQHGQRIFLYSIASRPALGSRQSPIQLVPGALSLELKWLGHEADHSHLVLRLTGS
jgi:hypothetical protein